MSVPADFISITETLLHTHLLTHCLSHKKINKTLGNIDDGKY